MSSPNAQLALAQSPISACEQSGGRWDSTINNESDVYYTQFGYKGACVSDITPVIVGSSAVIVIIIAVIIAIIMTVKRKRLNKKG
jgi:hypothetical protein